MTDQLTDLEITRLCAEAMGLKFSVYASNAGEIVRLSAHEIYNPLHDDAQAMALVKQHLVEISYSGRDGKFGAVAWGTTTMTTDADLNRAICECVARVQLEKEKKS